MIAIRNTIRPTLALALVALAAAGPSRAEPGPGAVLKTCAACHGVNGIGVDTDDPSLAGQKPAYLRAQLHAFRDGSRISDEMQPVAAKLTDAQIDALAAYYARQPRPPAKPASGAQAARGARLYDARGRGAPPCAVCHSGIGAGHMGGGFGGGGFGGGGFGGGMMGGGMMGLGGGHMRSDPALTPVLDGQHAPYLRAQLDAFASGRRKDRIMSPIAARLTPADRDALAAYLAGR